MSWKIFKSQFYNGIFKRIKWYFVNRMYERHFFTLLFFNNKDYITFRVAATSKKRHKRNWYLNNFIIPLSIILSPIILTWLHNHYNTVAYNKNIYEILISGSITLLGLNVLRTSSTSISEKIDISKVAAQYQNDVDTVVTELEAIKTHLEMRIFWLTLAGGIFYFIQVGQLVNMSQNVSYWFLTIVILLMVISLIHARFISLMRTDILNNHGIDLLFTALLTQKSDFDQMKGQLNQQGALL